MQYIQVHWIDAPEDEPVELWSELDDELWEIRKVEIFRDGRIGSASATHESESTGLGLIPVPPLETIGADPQFHLVHVSREDFDRLWAVAHQPTPSSASR